MEYLIEIATDTGLGYVVIILVFLLIGHIVIRIRKDMMNMGGDPHSDMYDHEKDGEK